MVDIWIALAKSPESCYCSDSHLRSSHSKDRTMRLYSMDMALSDATHYSKKLVYYHYSTL